MFNENTELLPSGDSSDIYHGNDNTTEGIKPVLVGIPFRNELGWVEVEKKD